MAKQNKKSVDEQYKKSVEKQFTDACCRDWNDTDAENKRKLTLAYQLFRENPSIDTFADDDRALKHACKIGDWGVIYFLIFFKLQVSYYRKKEAFVLCCESKNIDIADDIFNECGEIYHYGALKEAFDSACKLGNMDVAEWLVEIRLNRNIDDLYDFLSIAHKNNKIDFAKWMLTVKPELSDYAFLQAFDFRFGNEELGEWLCSQNPFKYVIEKKKSCKKGRIRNDCDANLSLLLYGILKHDCVKKSNEKNIDKNNEESDEDESEDHDENDDQIDEEIKEYNDCYNNITAENIENILEYLKI